MGLTITDGNIETSGNIDTGGSITIGGGSEIGGSIDTGGSIVDNSGSIVDSGEIESGSIDSGEAITTENSVKVSDITVQEIADYIRLTELSEEDEKFLTKCLEIAKSIIKNYTGVEDLDSQAEFVICIYLLCQDMYDSRTLYVDKDKLNNVFSTILNLHNYNLL